MQFLSKKKAFLRVQKLFQHPDETLDIHLLLWLASNCIERMFGLLNQSLKFSWCVSFGDWPPSRADMGFPSFLLVLSMFFMPPRVSMDEKVEQRTVLHFLA